MAKSIVPKCIQTMKVQHWAIAHCGLGAALLMLSLFIPRWRVDDIGTSDIQQHWALQGLSFESREYGLIYVKGTYAQSWQTMALAACDLQSIGYVTGWVSAVADSAAGGDQCNDDECSGGFFAHIAERCEVYRSIRVASHAAMGMTFMSIMMVIVGCILACMASTKRMGGIVLGLFMCGGMFSIVTGAWWIVASDVGFKRLGESAYYPYPSIGIAYFLHLYGSLALLVGGSVYGWIIWPAVSTWDEVQNKLDKKLKRYEARQERKAQNQLKAQEQQAQMEQMQQAQMMQQMQMQQQQQACMMNQSYPQPQQFGQGQDLQMGSANGALIQVGQAGNAGQQQQPLKANF